MRNSLIFLVPAAGDYGAEDEFAGFAEGFVDLCVAGEAVGAFGGVDEGGVEDPVGMVEDALLGDFVALGAVVAERSAAWPVIRKMFRES